MSEQAPTSVEENLDVDPGDRCTILCAWPDYHPGPCKTREQIDSDHAHEAPFVVSVRSVDANEPTHGFLSTEGHVVPLRRAETFNSYCDALDAAAEAAADGDGLIATSVEPQNR